MSLKNKIEKKIKEKELQLETLKKSHKNYQDQNMKNFDEDMKFKNTINPFYKRKYKSSVAGDIGIMFVECNLEKEIKELKELLNTTKK